MIPKHHWQYNGVATMAEIVVWCCRHIPGEFGHYGLETIVFHTERAQAMFLLKWA